MNRIFINAAIRFLALIIAGLILSVQVGCGNRAAKEDSPATVQAQESERTERITEPNQGTDRPSSTSRQPSGGDYYNSNSYNSNSRSSNSYNSNNRNSNGYGSSSSRDYSDLNNDPDDFDNPDDYADNAWGDDFDDWDEAYDYWEDNY